MQSWCGADQICPANFLEEAREAIHKWSSLLAALSTSKDPKMIARLTQTYALFLARSGTFDFVLDTKNDDF
jgi:hypothetical protein